MDSLLTQHKFQLQRLAAQKRKVLNNNSQLKLYSAPQLSSAHHEGHFDKEETVIFLPIYLGGNES